MTGQSATFREFADRVRATADIVEVVGQYVELRRAGTNLKGCCPFHQEKTPSFNVHPPKQVFKCFGCGKGGDVITFVREIERVDYREALEILARKYSLEVPRFKRESTQEDQEIRWRQTLQETLGHAAKFYQARLADPRQGAVAREYLEKRGISQETIAAFGLGVAADEWDALAKYLTAKGYTQKAMLEAGLVKARDGGDGVYDMFRGRLMFPIFNARGGAIAFGGRVFEGDGPKYINSPETPLFLKGRELYGLHAARDGMTRGKRPAVLVEGYMDVIAAHQAGVTTAVASLGTALTPDQARLIKRHSDEAVFLYDADEAGIKAILRGLESLVAANLKVRVGLMPDGEDPDSVARKYGADALRAVVDEAIPFFEFLLKYARARFDLVSPEENLKALELFQPALSAIAEPLVYQGYVTKLAAALGHEENALRQYLEKLRLSRNRRLTGSADAPPRSYAPQAASPAPDFYSPPPEYGGADMDYGAAPEPEEELMRIAPPVPRETGLLHILMEHADARVIAANALAPEWIQHPLVRYWVDVLLSIPAEEQDVWRALMARCQTPAQEAFLNEVVFTDRESLEENYLPILESLIGRVEAEYRKLENRRLNLQIQEASREQDPEKLQSLVAQQMRNLKRRLPAGRLATRHNTHMHTKH